MGHAMLVVPWGRRLLGDWEMRFQAKVIPSGNAAGIEIPEDAFKNLGGGARPLIVVTINGHTWRSRVALMRGQCLVGISAENRHASGISIGDVIEVDLALDTEPRIVSEPPDLAQALGEDPESRAAFDRLPFGIKRRHVTSIEQASSPATRQRRIDKLIQTMRSTRD